MARWLKWRDGHYIRCFDYSEISNNLVSAQPTIIDLGASTVATRYTNPTLTMLPLAHVAITDVYKYGITTSAPYVAGAGKLLNTYTAAADEMVTYLYGNNVDMLATSPNNQWATTQPFPKEVSITAQAAAGAFGHGLCTKEMYDYFLTLLVNPNSTWASLISAWRTDGAHDTADNFSPDNTYTIVLVQKTNNGDYSICPMWKSGFPVNAVFNGTVSRTTVTTLSVISDTNPNPQNTGNDPYTGAGYPESTAPGGMSQGSFDFTEDGITGVHTPGLDLLNTGLITAWRPSKATLAQLAGWLWVTTPGQVIQQLFGNPINAIIGLNVVPVSPPVDGGTNTIKFGVEDSGVACPKITSQHVTVDCGTLTIDPKYGSYMDFAPQTSAELFLPYVGGLPLDVNDVIGKTIGVKYQVDVLSGACVAYVFIDGVLHYQKAGGCAATAPITGSQMPNVVAGVLSIVGSVAGAVASAGASGASTAAKVASGIATGTSVAESAANMMKQSISYAGTISGWAGLLGAQKPYLILSLPHAAIPGGQNTLMGYPAWVSGRVGDFTGYTECTVDRVTATRATDQEVEEIKGLLEGGVIL